MNWNGTVASYQRVHLNSSKYFEKCWSKLDPGSNISSIDMLDTNFAYSKPEAYLAGLVNGVQSIVGSVLNLLVIFALLKNSELRKQPLTPSIISISITDLLFSGYILSVATIHWFTEDMPSISNCQIYAFVLYGLWLCSALNLVGIAVIRLLVVYFPWKYKTTDRKKRFWILPLLGWLISIIWLLPTLIGVFGQFGFECKTFKCKFINVDKCNDGIKMDPERIFTQMILFIGVVLLALNIATFLKLKKKSRVAYDSVKENKDRAAIKRVHAREKKVERMVIIVTTSFFVVYMPMVALRLIDPNAMITNRKSYIFCYLCTCLVGVIDPNAMITNKKSYIFCYLCTCLVGVIDPLVYIMCQESYRHEIKEIFQNVMYRKPNNMSLDRNT